MFEFVGELSEETKQIAYKLLRKSFYIIALIITVVLSIVVVPFGFVIHELLFLFELVPIAIGLAFCLTARSSIYAECPIRVMIDCNEDYMEMENSRGLMGTYEKVSNTEKILDFGSCYIFRFGTAQKEYFVCQKDLITKGTIEGFEERFKDLIEKKY